MEKKLHEHRWKGNKLYCPSFCFNNKRHQCSLVNVRKHLSSLALASQMLPHIYICQYNQFPIIKSALCEYFIWEGNEKPHTAFTCSSSSEQMNKMLFRSDKYTTQKIEITVIWKMQLDLACSHLHVCLLASHSHNTQCRRSEWWFEHEWNDLNLLADAWRFEIVKSLWACPAGWRSDTVTLFLQQIIGKTLCLLVYVFMLCIHRQIEGKVSMNCLLMA